VLLTQVAYDADGFCERNRDVLFRDLIELMQTSNKLVSFCAAAAAFFALFAFIPSFSIDSVVLRISAIISITISAEL